MSRPLHPTAKIVLWALCRRLFASAAIAWPADQDIFGYRSIADFGAITGRLPTVKKCILVVSREAEQRGSLARMLIRADYAVELAESVKHARNVVCGGDLALAIVVPRGLGGDCSELARELIATACPTIIISDERLPFDGLERSVIAAAVGAGAQIVTSADERAILPLVHDIVGPHDPREEQGLAPEFLHFEGLTLDLAGRALRGRDGQDVPLTRAEFALLAMFVRHPGRALSRDHLGNAIPGRATDADERSIDIMVWRLRRKVEVDPKAPSLILTVPGAGYKFTPAVEPASATDGHTRDAPELNSTSARAQRVERRHLTVLSCDLAGWAELSRLDPEGAHVVLSTFRRCAKAGRVSHAQTHGFLRRKQQSV
jgi:two-component system torCAD operon response regulator TorR